MIIGTIEVLLDDEGGVFLFEPLILKMLLFCARNRI